jgi:hypothetical protein
VTGLQYSSDGKKLLITTNDSRLRLYDMDDFTVISKYKGLVNEDLQIKARFTQDQTQIIAGSENSNVYIWFAFLFFSLFSSPSLLSPLSNLICLCVCRNVSTEEKTTEKLSTKPSKPKNVKNDAYEYFKGNTILSLRALIPVRQSLSSSFLLSACNSTVTCAECVPRSTVCNCLGLFAPFLLLFFFFFFFLLLLLLLLP